MSNFKVGDRVFHPDHGEGVVDSLCGDFVSVKYSHPDHGGQYYYTSTGKPIGMQEPNITKAGNTSETPNIFKVGDKVFHATWGEGEVIQIKPELNHRVTVSFDEYGFHRNFTAEGKRFGDDVELHHLTDKVMTKEPTPGPVVCRTKTDTRYTIGREEDMKEDSPKFLPGQVVTDGGGNRLIVEENDLEDDLITVASNEGYWAGPREEALERFIECTEGWKVSVTVDEEGYIDGLRIDEEEHPYDVGTTLSDWVASQLQSISFVEVIRQTEEDDNWLVEEEIGSKADFGKLRWSLLPWNAAEDVLKVLEFGARKYSEDNWRKVPEGYKRYRDAAMRHMVELMKGNEIDDESGMPHAAHAICCLMFMLEAGNDEA